MLLILIGALSFVFFQDIIERKVYWILFPIIGGLSAFIFLKNTVLESFLASVIFNIIFLTLLLLVVFFYVKVKLKTSFGKVFGLGDLLMFVAVAFSFSSISFVVIFIFSLIFSSIIHYLLRNTQSFTTVPLAGYMSLFLVFIHISYWLEITHNIYAI